MCQKWFVKFLGILTFWPNKSLLCGCPMHGKVFSSTLGLYPLEASKWEIANIVKISKSIKFSFSFSENEKCVFYFMEKT